MVEGTQAQAAGRSIRELERLRDDYLVAIQQVLRQFNIGAGATLRALEERLYRRTRAAAAPPPHRRGRSCRHAALRLIEYEVRPEWVDYNGHMTDSRYLQVFGDATDALLRSRGVDDAYRKSGRALLHGRDPRHAPVRGARARAAVCDDTMLDLDDKRVRLFHSSASAARRRTVATGEQLYLHVSRAAARRRRWRRRRDARQARARLPGAAACCRIAEPARRSRGGLRPRRGAARIYAQDRRSRRTPR